MEKEKVTEELVRQNGNQAAAVMADYAGKGGGSTGGIPTIDKNVQPNIVWREPTAEDLAKFQSSRIGQVADLPNGQVPVYLIFNEEGDEPGVETCVAHIVTTIAYPQDGMDGAVELGRVFFVLSGDWSLLGIQDKD